METKGIEFKREHWGVYKHNAEDHGRGSIIITGPIQGVDGVRFGRLVQVRKKSGAYGSDTVLVLEPGNKLASYHNMGFFSVAPQYRPLYEEALSDLEMYPEDEEFTILGKNPATGFVVHGLDDTFGETYSFTMEVTDESVSFSDTVVTKPKEEEL